MAFSVHGVRVADPTAETMLALDGVIKAGIAFLEIPWAVLLAPETAAETFNFFHDLTSEPQGVEF